MTPLIPGEDGEGGGRGLPFRLPSHLIMLYHPFLSRTLPDAGAMTAYQLSIVPSFIEGHLWEASDNFLVYNVHALAHSLKEVALQSRSI